MTSSLSPQVASLLVNASYLLTAFLFIMGLKRMSSPKTAKSGVIWAGWGMLVATLVTFLAPQIAGNYFLIVTAIFIGGVLAWWTGKRVAQGLLLGHIQQRSTTAWAAAQRRRSPQWSCFAVKHTPRRR